MNKRVTDLIEEARKLTLEERRELVRRLPHELNDEEADDSEKEIEQAWLEEVDRRIASHERGETTSSPASEVHARIRARLRKG